ncbi:MAG: ribosome biogenesis GTPase Der [Deltaproteobacteria bacterium]|nr:MAG: ribosome biogenesis GTPase Der [Deltaproteobacteria bacterium]
MLPIIAIVGRPNVGKSTLFNRLTRKRDALVDDIPGVTRDRLYATVEWNGKSFVLVDTGGFDSLGEERLSVEVTRQVEIAIQEADLVILLLDGKAGLTIGDKELYLLLKRSDKKVLCTVNKIDGPEHEWQSLEFYSLGMDRVFPISSAHGYGIGSLMDQIKVDLPSIEGLRVEEGRRGIAIIGRPNVGKSSLINRIIGFERLIVSEQPGTTRDAVDISFERRGEPYLLIDTAGIRRRTRVKERVEIFSTIKALKAISRCHIALILLDAQEGICEQDARICGYALDRGCGIILGLNKWDLVKTDPSRVRLMGNAIERRLAFISFAPMLHISALTGEGVSKLFPLIDRLWKQLNTRIPTPALNKALENAVGRHPPPQSRGKELKLLYATQVSVHPTTIIIFVNRADYVRRAYERYLINQFKAQLGLELIPLKIVFRER